MAAQQRSAGSAIISRQGQWLSALLPWPPDSLVVAVGEGLCVLLAWMMALCMPSAACWVNRTVIPTNPAAANLWRYSVLDRAPAMQPT